MSSKKLKGPSSFGEWVVGTTIQSALGPIPRKPPRRREIVRVEVSTDDESGEDSLRITYPRTGSLNSKKKGKKEGDKEKVTKVKKVRFEGTLPKSALKKTAEILSSETDREGSGSITEGSSSEDVSTTEASAESSDEQIKHSQKAKKKTKKQESGSEDDSEPHPTCKCSRCVRGRRKMRKNPNKSASTKDEDSSDDSSEPEAKSKSKSNSQKHDSTKKKEKKKQGEETAGADSGGETSGSIAQTESGLDEAKGNDQNENNSIRAQKLRKEKTGTDDSTEGDELAQRKKGQKGKKTEKGEDENNKSSKAKKQRRRTDGIYPEAFPLPHPRRPNYIEPVRAEVVQTERVIESPNDPPPNAYYDSEHNIIRIYHGPVWGGNSNQALYPRRDSSMRPLPIGMPHPTQNPYYWGFNNPSGHPHPGYDNGPVTQGMPPNSWSATCPPGLRPGGYAQNHLSGQLGQEPGMNKGAFHMSGANMGPPSTVDKDKAGANNIGPGSIKGGLDNPYYTRSKSAFRKWGESRTASHGSRQDANNAGDGAADKPSGSPARESTRWSSGGSKAAGNGNDNSNGGNGNSWTGNNTQDNWNNGNGYSDGNAWGDKNNGQDSWASKDNNAQDGWGNGNGHDNYNTTGVTDAQWATGDNVNANENGSYNTGGDMGSSNVVPEPTHAMPGSWNDPQPLWGDTTAAASTGGMVDDQNNERVAW